jgi:ATP-dependent RNA helicase DDX54/DBP10
VVGKKRPFEDDGKNTFFDRMPKKRAFNKRDRSGTYRDEEYYIPHVQKDVETERGYAIGGDTNGFSRQASAAQMDLMGDESSTLKKNKTGLHWDTKKKKFVRETVGADNKKLIRTDTGALVSASYKTNAYVMMNP